MSRRAPGWLFAAAVVALGGLAIAREPVPEASDDVALAGLLVRDGDWARAAEVLDRVDAGARGLDVTRYHTLRGLVALHEDRPADAVPEFEQAIASALAAGDRGDRERKAASDVDPTGLLQLHLARAQLGAGAPAAALVALDRSGEVGAALPGTYLLRAEAHDALGEPDDAWNALAAGAARFPDEPNLRRQQVFLLVRLGLFREARALGERLLADADASGDAYADDAVAISEALRRGGDAAQAQVILESALLAHGDDRDLLVQAARAAIDADQPRTAARFLERATEVDPALALEASEAYRRAGDTDAALRMNGLVADPVAKVRQRLGLLLEAEAWDRALALEERLVRLGLDGDDGVAYGLAFAAFRIGDAARAERWLRDITDPEAFRRATELRAALAASSGSSPP